MQSVLQMATFSLTQQFVTRESSQRLLMPPGLMLSVVQWSANHGFEEMASRN